MPVRIGIIGAGNMGRTHAAILKQDQRATIVGVTDMVPARAAALAVEIGARSFATVDDLLSATIDAVYVTIPNTSHAPLTLKALRAGMHVFCEKPMATSLSEATQVAQAVRAGGLVYQVGHNRRFAPCYRYLKDQIEAGFTPYLANAKQNDGDWFNPPWITDLTITGGFLYDTTIHLLDMLRWLMGDVVSVAAQAKANVYAGVVNDFAILLTFEGGRSAVLSSSAHASWAFPFEHLEIVGEHALIRSEELTRAVHAPGLEQPVLIHDYSAVPQPERWGYREEDRLFVSACLGEIVSPVDAEEGLKSVELCEACYRSVALGGQPVRLPLVDK